MLPKDGWWNLLSNRDLCYGFGGAILETERMLRFVPDGRDTRATGVRYGLK